jgi:FkbM family methyltransferase
MDKPEEQFYSQSEQDKYLEKIFFKGYKKGFYVDVGAHDGITINNTLYFEKNHNWTGINVEPIKSVFDKLVTNRPNNVNLNYAVCNNDGETEFLCNKGYTEMISGIKSNFDPRHLQRLHDENIQMGSTTELIKVNTKKLETIFDENNVSHINYLSIDVEGAEFEVIKSINFDKVFIDIINFEDNYSDVSIPIIKYLEDKNFVELDKRYGDIFMIHKQSIFYKQNINYNFKIIGFHSNQLCERGTEVAMYDYAYYNEKMYGNKSVIFYCKHNTNNDANVIKKFEAQFKCFAYDNFLDIEQIINNEKIDYFYNCKSGSRNDNQLIKSCPNLIHAVFTVDPHGERYATISESLSKKHNNTVDYVPYMLNLPRCDENMRHQLNIPNDAVIMGRYGGYYQFDIQIAHEAIKTILNTETNMYFVFANTNVFYKHPRIIYLDKIIDLENKVKFINTCDAMIHARSDGETFGLAVGEFSSCGKPVITCKSHIDNAHIDILGEKAIIFNTEESLVEIFKNIKYIINGRSRSDWNAFGDYTPEKVMTKFFKVFIDVKENIDYIDMSKEITTYSNENMKK